MQALSADELMAWVERTTLGWQELVTVRPEILAVPCSVRETHCVAELLQHIVAVELRYAERLNGLAATEYGQIGFESEVIFGTHERAMTLLWTALEQPGTDWEETLIMVTRSAGEVRASRRTVLVHALMHSIRHYAQLATLVREHGIRPGWPMDYLFMGV